MINKEIFEKIILHFKNSFRPNILGKPIKNQNIISLKKHTTNVADEMSLIIRRQPFVINKLKELLGITDDFISKSLTYSVVFHDIGKAEDQWQFHCNNNTLMNVELRHEFISLFTIIDCLPNSTKDSPSILYFHIFAAILSHHGNLSKDIDKISKINKTRLSMLIEHSDYLRSNDLTIIEYIIKYFNQ